MLFFWSGGVRNKKKTFTCLFLGLAVLFFFLTTSPSPQKKTWDGLADTGRGIVRKSSMLGGHTTHSSLSASQWIFDTVFFFFFFVGGIFFFESFVFLFLYFLLLRKKEFAQRKNNCCFLLTKIKNSFCSLSSFFVFKWIFFWTKKKKPFGVHQEEWNDQWWVV